MGAPARTFIEPEYPGSSDMIDVCSTTSVEVVVRLAWAIRGSKPPASVKRTRRFLHVYSHARSHPVVGTFRALAHPAGGRPRRHHRQHRAAAGAARARTVR